MPPQASFQLKKKRMLEKSRLYVLSSSTPVPSWTKQKILYPGENTNKDRLSDALRRETTCFLKTKLGTAEELGISPKSVT